MVGGVFSGSGFGLFGGVCGSLLRLARLSGGFDVDETLSGDFDACETLSGDFDARGAVLEEVDAVPGSSCCGTSLRLTGTGPSLWKTDVFSLLEGGGGPRRTAIAHESP